MKNDWNPEDASGGTVLDNLTRDRLEELESAPRTPMRLFCDYLICFLPVLAGCMALAMTPEEETAYFREQTASVFEKFDIKRSSLMPVKPRRRERIAG